MHSREIAAPVLATGAAPLRAHAAANRAIASLNGLRALSVLLVIASHLATCESTPAALNGFFHLFNGGLFNGALGVRVFFCISGFLITTLILDERARTGRVDLPAFYMRRALRIWPALYLFVLFMFLASRLTALDVSACQFATALTFTKNYGCSGWIDGHLWSLGVEFQFYLFWPAVLVLAPTRFAVGGALLAVALAPLSRFVEIGFDTPQWWLTSNMDGLMIGSFVALARRNASGDYGRVLRAAPAIARAGGFVVLIAPVLAGQAFPDAAAPALFGPTVQAVAATFLVASYADGPDGWTRRALNSAPLDRLGVMSYSLYVWQEAFFVWPADFGFERLVTFEWPFNLIGMFAVAALSYRLAERPLVHWRRRLAV